MFHGRLALERQLGKDALECKEVIDLMKEVRLMNSVVGFGKFYEVLVQEFTVNLFRIVITIGVKNLGRCI